MNDAALGPNARALFARMTREWKQGEHVFISGQTGSGKTTLARRLADIRLRAHGNVLLMSTKMRPDATLVRDYKGWDRWEKMHKRPKAHERAIILQPNTRGKPQREALQIQKEVFADMWDILSIVGKWTVIVDEGLYVASPSYLGQANDLGLSYQQGRTSFLTMVTLAQRPSHLPLNIYSNVDYAFLGRCRETSDLKRLAEIGGREESKTLAKLIDAQGKHDFRYIPAGSDLPSERLNLRE